MRLHQAGDIDASRERCATLVGFIKEAWHVLEPMQPYIHTWNIDAMAIHLEAQTRGQLQHLVFNVPPGSMKSLMASVFHTAWEWGPAGLPHLRILTCSFEQELAHRDNEKLRRLIESDWYQDRWPLPLMSRGVKRFRNAKGGDRWARAFMSMTGGRGNRVIIDDPHSTRGAESDVVRGAIVTQFREGITDRLNNMATDTITVMMQRLHGNDVSGVIEELGLDFTRVVIPMEFDPKRRCITRLRDGTEFWRDPRSVDKELMAPERWPRDVLDKLYKGKGSYAVAGQYQQAPVPREGGLFKRSWFDGKFLDACPPLEHQVRHWDLADTDLTANDMRSARTAGVKMGLDAAGNIIILDMRAGGMEGSFGRLIKPTAELDGRAIPISLPKDPGQAGKVQARNYVKQLKGWSVRASPETGDKVTRAVPLANQAEAGNVFILRGSWNQEFLDELCNFPGGARKDIADACSGAFAHLVQFLPDDNGGGLAGAEEIQQDEEAEADQVEIDYDAPGAKRGPRQPNHEPDEDEAVWA